MSLEEKEYIFGHRISGKDGAKKRIEYSRNMDRLWRIAQKLDKAPFCKKLYELHFPQIIVGDGIVVQEGRGQGTIRIPWKSAVYGRKLHLHFEGGPNTSVSISTPNAVRPFGGLPVEVKMADAPISWGGPLPPINAEAAKSRFAVGSSRRKISVSMAHAERMEMSCRSPLDSA